MRKKTFHILKEARKLGEYAEMPMLPDEKQIQVFVSRNQTTQPFHLICAKDSLVAIVSGTGSVTFKESTVTGHAYEAGSFLYVPAGVPHRVEPASQTVMLRYKHRPATLEGVAWYCDGCGAEVYREVFDTNTAIEQAKYQEVTDRFTADAALRTCPGCCTVHPGIETARYDWPVLAGKVQADRDDA